MKCFFCDTEVRWNWDYDSEDIDPDSEYTITSIMNVIIVRLGMRYLLIKKRKKNEKRNNF